MKAQTFHPYPTSGIYYWAGPGTIRMLQLKYPRARINTQSFIDSYEYETLAKAQATFQITDAWVTYSWGFGPVTEAADYQWLARKLPNFQKLKIRTHAYIQGFNLVREEHPTDYYCRTSHGGLIPYHRGRKMTCPNNPRFQKYLSDKVAQALQLPVSGIFIDNIVFGQIPLQVGNKYTFFGCACAFCQRVFKNRYGTGIPAFFQIGSTLFKNYLEFRVATTTKLLAGIAKQVHQAGKLFGTNSFDPFFFPPLFYGFDLRQLAAFQDYILFENHFLPQLENGRNNHYLIPMLKQLRKPVFVVSYKRGIGQDRAFAQTDLIWYIQKVSNWDIFRVIKPVNIKRIKFGTIWYLSGISLHVCATH